MTASFVAPVAMSLRRPGSRMSDDDARRLENAPVNYHGPAAWRGRDGDGDDADSRTGKVGFALRRVSRSGIVGYGDGDFRRGVGVLERWGQCNLGWTTTTTTSTSTAPSTTVREGSRFKLSARTLGVWISNPLVVVHVERDVGGRWLPRWRRRNRRATKRMCVASRTLRGHLLQGEESFVLEHKHDGGVRFTVTSVSRPCHALSVIGYPLLCLQQSRFLGNSLRAVRRALASPGEGVG